MNSSTHEFGEAIYFVGDLLDAEVYGRGDWTVLVIPEGRSFRFVLRKPWDWTSYYYGEGAGVRPDAHPATVAAWLRTIVSPQARRHEAPSIDGAKLARKIAARRPLTPGALIEDPEFARAALACARADKKYTQELLSWEKKETVMIAVSHFAEVVAAERKAEAQRQAALAAERKAQLDRERPTRAAVTAAYLDCGYRECKQGHSFEVRITATGYPAVSSDTVRGERYSSRCTFAKTESVHRVTVREDWLTKVAAIDLETFEGRLVLDAECVGHTADAPVYRLLTVRQGRGTSLETERLEVVAGLKARRRAPADAVAEYTHPAVARDACIDAGVIDE